MGTAELASSPQLLAQARARALDLLAYIHRSPTPYHAVGETAARLEASGFLPLDEREVWQLSAGDRRFVTRNGSSIVAFQLGTNAPSRSGFQMIGAHTDSPNLKLKPRASFHKRGYQQLGVEVYGGVLLSTWLARDLSPAGPVAGRTAKGVE